MVISESFKCRVASVVSEGRNALESAVGNNFTLAFHCAHQVGVAKTRNLTFMVSTLRKCFKKSLEAPNRQPETYVFVVFIFQDAFCSDSVAFMPGMTTSCNEIPPNLFIYHFYFRNYKSYYKVLRKLMVKQKAPTIPNKKGTHSALMS